uniref:Uncharacterized protein n=1 Tax=Globisporangium ultimum (strain ATCC 200006 / CBS 805.95 / DAOM BR144) TaxID=431595 RepID=K3W957_GLOUD
MFAAKKLVLIATACMALACSSTHAATESSHVRIHVRQSEDLNTTAPVAPPAAPLLNTTPSGSGSYGSEDSGSDDSDSDDCTGAGESPMSVAGAEGVFCVTGQACVADIEGACPGPQDGLELGSTCTKSASGIWGCQQNKSKHHHKKSHHGKN